MLLIIYLGYLALGMTVFNLTECPAELDARKALRKADLQLSGLLERMEHKLDKKDRELLERIGKQLSKRGIGVLRYKLENSSQVCDKWDHANSLFFAFTVVTTIGKPPSLVMPCSRVRSPGPHHPRGPDVLPPLRPHRRPTQRHPDRGHGISVW